MQGIRAPGMRLTRCYVPTALQSQSTLWLPAAAAAHVAKVLRLRAGAALTLFDGRGGEFEAQVLTLERRGVQVRVGLHRAIERESPIPVALLQCLVRAERMDWIVQKATELGVAAIVPLASEHSVVRLDDSSAERRVSHWQAVALSACEQCGRNRVPSVHAAVAFERACADARQYGAIDARPAGAAVIGERRARAGSGARNGLECAGRPGRRLQ